MIFPYIVTIKNIHTGQTREYLAWAKSTYIAEFCADFYNCDWNWHCIDCRPAEEGEY